jgi:predicted HicB family RNase H-like nuclease
VLILISLTTNLVSYLQPKKDDVKESTNQFKESTDRYLEQQKQQFGYGI